MAVDRSGSILAVDFGNVHTRALLIDLVEGVYRLVATGRVRTTAGFPAGDVGVGLRRALDQIGTHTGRRLLDDEARLIVPEGDDRSGVDHVVMTASIGRPLRTVLLGLVPGVSLASGLRAVAGTYVQVVETLSLDDNRGEQDQINAIVLSRPDLIFITGGTEDGARDSVLKMARVAQLAVRLMRSQRKPFVLYAGNSALLPEMRALFDGLTSLFIAPNVRPTLETEALDAAQLQLAMAFDASAAQQGAGFGAVSSLSRLGILPTAQSYNLLVDYLGQAFPGGVLAVDVGGAVGTLSASYKGRVNTMIRTDLGLGQSAPALLDAASVDAVRAWLPFNVGREELVAYAANKVLRPGSIPETLREFYLEHALLRAALRLLVGAAAPLWDASLADLSEAPLPAFNRLIGAGAALTQTGRPGLAALLLLDTLAPQGVTSLYADPYALIPALGALAHLHPAAVVQVLNSSALERIGLAFNVSGAPREGATALRVAITTSRGEQITHEVEGGHLWVYPLGAGEQVELDVRVNGGQIDGKRRVRMTAEGGSLGLIFDARGRPLPLGLDARARAAQFPQWIAEMTGDDPRPIDEAWLAPVVDEDEPPEIKAPPAGRGKDRGKRADRRAPAADAPAAKAPRPERGRRRGKAEAPPADDEDEVDELRKLFS